MLVYKLISPSNKFYIGKTKYNSFNDRWRQHVTLWKKLTKTKNYKDAPTKLLYAFDKYPPKEWTYEIICECHTLEELNQKEIDAIELFNTINTGYNITKGGDGRLVDFLEEEHKRKISESRIKWFQTPVGIEWKEHLSNKNKGNIYFGAEPPNIKWSEESKKAFSEQLQGRIPWNKGKTKVYSNEHNTLIGEKAKQRHANGEYDYKAMAEMRKGFHQPESQKIKVAAALAEDYDYISPEGVPTHINNLLKFCRENDLDQGNMLRVHQGKTGYKSHKGWRKG